MQTMLNIDKMEVDLSIVKKERLEFDDYGQNTGNILDNFLAEHDYNDFPQSVPTVVSTVVVLSADSGKYCCCFVGKVFTSCFYKNFWFIVHSFMEKNYTSK